MRHVFISYSRLDNEPVDLIVARLVKDDFRVWLDRQDLKADTLWREEIVEAIDQSYALVLLLSPNSAASDNVRKQVDLAEGAKTEIIPVLLLPVKVPAKLRHPLAGNQWIKYYDDPEAKYAELVEVLRVHRPDPIASDTQTRREMEIVITKLNASAFGQEQQEALFSFFTEFTSTPRADIRLTRLTAGSVHVFVTLPVKAAYRLKTAALNSDLRLINSGIDAIRLTGDSHFVFLKTGRIAPLKAGAVRRRFIGVLAMMITLLLAATLAYAALPIFTQRRLSFVPLPLFATASHTPTSTFTPTVTGTFTSTPSQTPTPTETRTPTPTRRSTIAPTSTIALSSTPSIPIFTFTTGAFCRSGPGTAYREVTGIGADNTVEITGRNADNSWYYIFWEKFNVKCWVSAITGQAYGDLVGVPVLAP